MSMKVTSKSELDKISVYQPGKPIEEVKRQFGLERIIKLASNENPFGYSSYAREAMKRALDDITLYPEASAPQLGAKLSARLGVQPDKILIGNGSDEIIRLISRAYIRQGDEAVMADVTFSRYETNVIIDGGVPVKVPLQDGVHNLDAMRKTITDKTRIVFVCNPNNPTGTTVRREALRRFIAEVPSHILLVVDEAYYEYVATDDYLQTIPLLDAHPNLVILRTFSKIYGLAALRIGYALAQQDAIQNLIKVKDAFSTNRLAQAAAIASLDDDAFVMGCHDMNRDGRIALSRAFDEMGLKYYPSETNFVLVHVGRDGNDVFDALLRHGIIVRAGRQCDAYPDTIRVTVGTEDENTQFLAALRSVLA